MSEKSLIELHGLTKTYGKGAKFKTIEAAPGRYVKVKA